MFSMAVEKNVLLLEKNLQWAFLLLDIVLKNISVLKKIYSSG
jgi:hypothetical protein